MVDEIGLFIGGSGEGVACRLAAAAPSSLGRDGIPIADTTGAGDAFNAALLYGIATGAATIAICLFPVYSLLLRVQRPICATAHKYSAVSISVHLMRTVGQFGNSSNMPIVPLPVMGISATVCRSVANKHDGVGERHSGQQLHSGWGASGHATSRSRRQCPADAPGAVGVKIRLWGYFGQLGRRIAVPWQFFCWVLERALHLESTFAL